MKLENQSVFCFQFGLESRPDTWQRHLQTFPRPETPGAGNMKSNLEQIVSTEA